MALENVLRALRPGGTTVVGAHDTPDDALAAALDNLMTVRSGGAVLDPAGAIERLERAGFVRAREIERTWQAAVRLAAGDAPGA